MPQLDKVTFFPQYFWLCFFYIGFYYTLVKYFLPKISRILAIRQTKLQNSHQGIHSVHDESSQRQLESHHLGSQGFSASKQMFENFLPETSSWVQSTLASSNRSRYTAVNESYIQSIGETPLCQNIRYYHARHGEAMPTSLAAHLFLATARMLQKTSKK